MFRGKQNSDLKMPFRQIIDMTWWQYLQHNRRRPQRYCQASHPQRATPFSRWNSSLFAQLGNLFRPSCRGFHYAHSKTIWENVEFGVSFGDYRLKSFSQNWPLPTLIWWHTPLLDRATRVTTWTLSRFQQEEPAKRPFSLMAVKFNNNFKLQLKDYSILKRNVPLKRYPRSRMDFTGLRHLVDPWVGWELRCPSPICRQHRLVRLSHRKSLIQSNNNNLNE